MSSQGMTRLPYFVFALMLARLLSCVPLASANKPQQSTTSRRHSVDLQEAAIVDAFDNLPHKVSNLDPIKKIHVLLPYSNRKFKVAPRWWQAAKFSIVVDKILQASKGQNITQLSGIKGIKKYVSDNQLENKYDDEAVDRAAYTIRAVIAQMFNHKEKEL